MKKSTSWIVMAALAVFSTSATAQDLNGKAAPETPIRTAWNALGEKSLKDFKGKAILLEIFATW